MTTPYFRMTPEKRAAACARGSAYYRAHPERNKISRLKRKYGITITRAEYLALEKHQHGKCAICGFKPL
jgi:hypothetical protein